MSQDSKATIAWFGRRLNAVDSSKYSLDGQFAIEAVREAIQAIKEGNFGAGCVLVDAEGSIAARGHNQVFSPRFRSEAHAEMMTMSAFEEKFPKGVSMRGYTLYASLEPCPMCMTRLITSGCENIRYVAKDDLGGMVRFGARLPGVWPQLASRQVWEMAHCSSSLRSLAWEVFQFNVVKLNSMLDGR